MKLKYLVLIIALCIVIPVGVLANAPVQLPDPNTNITSAYRKLKTISPTVSIPTVVDIPFGADFLERYNFAVLDTTTNTFEPSVFIQKTSTNTTPLRATATNNGNSYSMIDNNVVTYSEFPVSDTNTNATTITLTSSKPIATFALTTLLDNYVALPHTIEIMTRDAGGNRVVVARKAMDSQTIRFPKTTASTWVITFTYGQPLRIAELKFVEENQSQTNSQSLRFLAQPGHGYTIYFDADRYVTAPTSEAGNLADDQDVKKMPESPSQNNPSYVMADTDNDAIPDIRDNCVNIANTDQIDTSGNGRGDACDDFDKDNIINSIDNCPSQPNRDQRDEDGDKIGDVCDGEESRITEKYPWLPWIGIGAAAAVLIGLFAVTAVSMRKNPPQV